MKKELKYPEDLPIVMRDIMESTEPNTEARKTMVEGQVENWKLGIIKAFWDDTQGIEIGKRGCVVWKFNDDWEIIER
jgi:hypothetical protein